MSEEEKERLLFNGQHVKVFTKKAVFHRVVIDGVEVSFVRKATVEFIGRDIPVIHLEILELPGRQESLKGAS